MGFINTIINWLKPPETNIPLNIISIVIASILSLLFFIWLFQQIKKIKKNEKGEKMKNIIPILLILLILPITSADFGYIPKQTITAEYPEQYGKYVNSSTILTNEENNSIIIETIASQKILIEKNIILQPMEKKNVEFMVLIDSPSQEESIQVKQANKNYGGILLIKVNGLPISNQSYSEATGFICTESEKNISCTSPLKNITINKPKRIKSNWTTIIIGIIILIIIAIFFIFRKKNNPTLYPQYEKTSYGNAI